jgi:hypothetical protein
MPLRLAAILLRGAMPAHCQNQLSRNIIALMQEYVASAQYYCA